MWSTIGNFGNPYGMQYSEQRTFVPAPSGGTPQAGSGWGFGGDQVTLSSAQDLSDRLNMDLVNQYRAAGKAFPTQQALDGATIKPPAQPAAPAAPPAPAPGPAPSSAPARTTPIPRATLVPGQ